MALVRLPPQFHPRLLLLLLLIRQRQCQSEDENKDWSKREAKVK